MAIKYLKNFISGVRKVDSFLSDKKIYQILLSVLLFIIFFVFSNSFSIDKNFRNYIVGDVDEIQVMSSGKYYMSFEAQENSLDYVRIMINSSKSHLSSNDRVNVTLSNDNDKVLTSTNAYLYNGNRNYIIIDFDGVSLEKGEWYYLSFDFSSMSPQSLLTITSHKVSSFSEALSYTQSSDDNLSLDMPIGFSKLINISYYYSVINPVSIILHVLVLALLIFFVFARDIIHNRYVFEVIKTLYLSLLIYLLPEILNIEKNKNLCFLFPLNSKQLFCLISSLLIISLLYLVFYMLIGKATVSALIVSIVCAVLSFVNHTKLVMRGDSFMPWDLFSAGIGIKTGSTYYFHTTSNFWCGILLCVVIVLFIRITDTPYIKFSKLRLINSMMFVSVLIMVLNITVLNTRLLNKLKIYYEVNPPIQSYNENGTYMAFLMHLNNFEAKGGVSNSPEATNEIIYRYTGIASEMNLDDRVRSLDVQPNVICIMSESFADLRHIRNFDTSDEIMPFYDSFIDDTIHGNLTVSIFGGGTCNTEFEFLTGYSMANLLPGASVYSLYINGPTCALPQIYKDNGYRTVALHSFDGSWWDRSTKYPYMGFDDFYTRDDFDESAVYVRRYISDMSTFERITGICEETEQPLFLFCVTMQNHGDFASRYDNMNYDITLEELRNSDGSNFNYTENYLSLLRESDDALEYLISYLRESDEPTILVFFGDHYPTLDTGFYSNLLQTNLGEATLEESLPIYETPYFIWTNFDDLNSSEFDLYRSTFTSPNFLGQTLLDLSGVDSPDSRNCLRVLQQNISAISALAVYDLAGEEHTNTETLDDDINQIIDDYSAIEYGLVYYDTYSNQVNSDV